MNANTVPEPITDRNEPLTIKEIARLAGVSIGTVDRVLHRRGRVSAENQSKIEAIVAARGYQPNLHASRLSTGASRTKTLGVLIPRLDQDLGYWQMVHQGIDAAREDLFSLPARITVEIFDRSSPDDCDRAFVRLVESGCDAMALAPIHSGVLRPRVEALDPRIPVVFFDSDMDCRRPHGFVGQDPWLSGRLAARLMDRNLFPAEEAAVVRFSGDDEHLARRVEGFLTFMGEASRTVHVMDQSLSSSPAERATAWEEFRRGKVHIEGLFVPNATVSQYVAEQAPRVVVGYDLLDANRTALEGSRIHYLISQRPEAMCREALRLLWRALNGRGTCEAKHLMPIEIIVPENLESSSRP